MNNTVAEDPRAVLNREEAPEKDEGEQGRQSRAKQGTVICDSCKND